MVLSLSKKGWFLRFFAKQWRKDNQQIVNLRFLLARLPRRVTAGDMTSIWLMVVSSTSPARNTVSTAYRPLEMIIMVTILEAKRIITMNPGNPYATHIAIKDGIILGVGSLEELTGWGKYTLDRRFADQVIVPGFVEAHAHVMAGGMLLLPFMGYYDRYRGDGSLAPGIKSYDALIEALREEERA